MRLLCTRQRRRCGRGWLLRCFAGGGRVASGGCGRGSRLRYRLLGLGLGGEKVAVWGRGRWREWDRGMGVGRLGVDAVDLGS